MEVLKESSGYAASDSRKFKTFSTVDFFSDDFQKEFNDA